MGDLALQSGGRYRTRTCGLLRVKHIGLNGVAYIPIPQAKPVQLWCQSGTN